MKKHLILMAACALAAMALSCNPTNLNRKLKETGWPTDCTDRYMMGVSAPFCGVVEGTVLSAGGANFPEIPAAYGGLKELYNEIYLLTQDGWISAGKLPFPSAYGGCVNIGGRLIAVGGSNGDKAITNVFAFVINENKVTTEALTPLPIGIEQAGYACDDSTIYVAGGITPSRLNDKVYEGKVSGNEIIWSELASMPEKLVQPVAFHANGSLYLWGGFDPTSKTVSCKGWKLNKTTGEWTLLEERQETLTGATAVALPDGRMAVVGGVDKDVFTYGMNAVREKKRMYMVMEPEKYRFNRTLRIFDPAEEKWAAYGEADALALAGAGVAADTERIYIIGGEIKPGIRTPRSWKLKLR